MVGEGLPDGVDPNFLPGTLKLTAKAPKFFSRWLVQNEFPFGSKFAPIFFKEDLLLVSGRVLGKT